MTKHISLHTIRIRLNDPETTTTRAIQRIEDAIRYYYSTVYDEHSLDLRVDDPRRIRAGKKSWHTRRRNKGTSS